MNSIDSIFKKILAGDRIDFQEAMLLATEAPLAQLGAAANLRKQAVSGDKVFYNRNFHIEPSNICSYNCKFCSYR